MADYWTPAAEDVKGAERAGLEAAVEALIPNHLAGDGRVASYSDLLEDLEGLYRRADGTWVLLDLGNSLDSPLYKAVKALARRVVREAQA